MVQKIVYFPKEAGKSYISGVYCDLIEPLLLIILVFVSQELVLLELFSWLLKLHLFNLEILLGKVETVTLTEMAFITINKNLWDFQNRMIVCNVITLSLELC